MQLFTQFFGVARTSFSANGFQYNSGKYWASKGIKTAVIMGPDYSAGHSFLGAFKRGFGILCWYAKESATIVRQF